MWDQTSREPHFSYRTGLKPAKKKRSSPRPSCWNAGRANPRLNFSPGFFFSKAFSRIIFSIFSRASNHQIVDKKITLNLLFMLSYLNSNFALTPLYFNPALKNPAQQDHIASKKQSQSPLHDLHDSFSQSVFSTGLTYTELISFRPELKTKVTQTISP